MEHPYAWKPQRWETRYLVYLFLAVIKHPDDAVRREILTVASHGAQTDPPLATRMERLRSAYEKTRQEDGFRSAIDCGPTEAS